MNTAYEKITVSLQEGIASVKLNTPPGNILDLATLAELDRAVEECRTDRSIKVLLLSSAGTHFSYGASVPEHHRDKVRRFLGAFHRTCLSLVECDLPTVAVVRGKCLGGGMELALACSITIATENSEFALPEIKLGVFPPAASLLLSWRTSAARATDMILSGRSISGREALEAGLVSFITSEGEVASFAENYMRRELLPKSRVALCMANRASRLSLADQLRRQLPILEQWYLDELMLTHDANEGIQAFLEKRPPKWTDR